MEVYLDNSATTRAYDSVRDIVAKTMCEDYGNPSSMHVPQRHQHNRTHRIYNSVSPLFHS